MTTREQDFVASLMPSFQAWAKTMPADETYDYIDNGNCAFAQFLKSEGYHDPIDLGYWFRVNRGSLVAYKHMDGVPLMISVGDQTFGALSKRLDAYFTDHPHKLPVLTAGML